jgi:hypothetical protein
MPAPGKCPPVNSGFNCIDKLNSPFKQAWIRAGIFIFCLLILNLILLPCNVAAMHKGLTINCGLTDTSKSIFLQAIPSKTKVYVGEAFTVSYFLYSSIHVTDPGDEIDLKFKNCYAEEFPPNKEAKDLTISGKIYHAVLLKKMLLIAQNEGESKTSAISINLKVDAPAVANDYFGTEGTVTKKISSPVYTVTVIPLPPKTDSTAFAGAVGDFKLSCNLIQSKTRPNTLKVILNINGTGNLKFANFSPPQLPNGLELFNEKNTDSQLLTESGMEARHIYSFEVVANYRGRYDIPPVTFLFFNPASSKYVKFSSEIFKWNVKEGPVLPHALANNPSKQKIADVLFTKTDIETGEENAGIKHWGTYAALLMLSVAFFTAGLINLYYQKSKSLDPAGYNYKTAGKRAIRNIKKLKLKNDDEDAFNKTLVQIFQKYLCDKNRISFNDAYLFNVNTVLRLQPLPDTIKNQAVNFLDLKYKSRFSLNKPNDMDREQSCLTLLHIIKSLEDLFKPMEDK